MSFFSQTTVSTCYAISLQKVYKLSGKFINLIECLTSFPRQGNNTLQSVHGIVEGWGGGVGWKSWGGGGGGWLEVLGGGGGWWLEVLAVRCDSANFVKTSQYPPPPPLPPVKSSDPPPCPCCRETVKPLTWFINCLVSL